MSDLKQTAEKQDTNVMLTAKKIEKEDPRKISAVKTYFVKFFSKYKPSSFKNPTEFLKVFNKQKIKINLSSPAVLRVIARSNVQILKAVGARIAVKLGNKKLQKLFLKDATPLVVKELSKTVDADIALKLINDPNTTGKALDRLSYNLFKNLTAANASVTLRAIFGILRHHNTFQNTIHNMIYFTRNLYIISMILKHKALSGYMLTNILRFNIKNSKIMMLALRTKQATISHFMYAAKNSNDSGVLGLCALQKDPGILKILIGKLKNFNQLIKNKNLTGPLLIMIARKNLNNLLVLKSLMMHPNGRNNVELWKILLKTSQRKFILSYLLKSNKVSDRLIIAQSYSEKLTNEQFKTLLSDSNEIIRNTLKNHKSEKVRVRVSQFSQDKNYLLEQASNSRSIKVKIAIARRKRIPRDVELSLISKRNDEVFLALANRSTDILTETESALAETGNKATLIALSKRRTIKKVEVLKILAASGIEEVELSLLKRYKNLKIHQEIVNKSKSSKVLLFALQTGDLALRMTVASRSYNYQKPLLLSVLPLIIRDSKPKVKASLLTNKTFLTILWDLIHDKSLQNKTNPYFFAFQRLQTDQNPIIKERLITLLSRLNTAKKEEIKKWVFKKV